MRMATAAIFAIILIAAPLAAAGTGPVINFDNESHDYGRVIYGDTVTHEFTLTNTGDQTLTIGKLESSCGCTKAVKGDSEVPPHEKTHILVSFNTNGLRAGKKYKRVFVHSNDPNRPVVVLTLSADVVRQLSIDPPSIARKLPSPVETLSIPMKVTNSSDRTVTIKQVEASGGTLQAILDPEHMVVGPRSTTSFTLVLNLKNEPNRYFWMGKILMGTDHPREKELEIRYLIELKTN